MTGRALRVGFIGFGEAARVFAAGLRPGGPELLAFCRGPRHAPPYAPEFRQAAAALGVELVDTVAELARRADVLFSAVAPGAAETVGVEAAAALRPGQVFADVNAVSPATKEAIAAAVAARGAAFVDAELMGAASLYGAAVPLYVSGGGAEEFKRVFAPLGLNVTVVPGAAGAAAALKMFRSVVTKGMEAIVVEAMFAAFRAGLAREAFTAITEPMDAVKYSEFARMCITSDPIHAGRRADEMAIVSEVLRALGVEPIMVEATRRRLGWSASLGARQAVESQGLTDYLEVLRLYDRLERRPDGPTSSADRTPGSTPSRP
jgi:3-hydroxyisobutyrate dehydrogenase-like beta-hydroxyacid dehydrogenase